MGSGLVDKLGIVILRDVARETSEELSFHHSVFTQRCQDDPGISRVLKPRYSATSCLIHVARNLSLFLYHGPVRPERERKARNRHVRLVRYYDP